ncbi:MAG: hypothetical protein OEU92_29225, partial [Alphaproteobacteria bacterium]|nr:hypothetical protein [Alphaproteobacteria bacterium]
MLYLRLCVCLMLIPLASAPALAKTETLAERGKRMCEEAGVPLDDCQMLPPAMRGTDPNAAVAEATPAPLPMNDLGPSAAAFGTGKYGWCEDCTSLLAAAPVTPWSAFSGRQFQPIRDEDDGRASAGNSSPAESPASGGTSTGGEDSGGGETGDSGDGDTGEDGGSGDGDTGEDGGSGGGGEDGDAGDGDTGSGGEDGGSGDGGSGGGEDGDTGDGGSGDGRSGDGGDTGGGNGKDGDTGGGNGKDGDTGGGNGKD